MITTQSAPEVPADTGQVPENFLLSVIVPCYNEAEVIDLTYRALTDALTTEQFSLEFLFIDDGSQDATLEKLRRIAREDQRVRVLSLSRNFGHQMALTAGLDHARGDLVALIDADLQDPPEVILEMVEKWREGYQVVYGQRVDREGETAFKQASSRGFYRLLRFLSDTDIPADTGDFRVIDRRIVETLRLMPEKDRFLRGMIGWTGFRQTAIRYTRRARAAGTTKYPLRKMVGFATSGILAFSSRPLRLATWTGLGISLLAAIGIIYAIALRLFTSYWVSGWTFTIVAILFIGGIQLLFLGLIGEYIARIYTENKNRPHYIVQEEISFQDLIEATCND